VTPALVMTALAGGIIAAANGAASGPDYVGIAAVIAACASAFGTVIAGIITVLRFLRREEGVTPEEIKQIVEQAVKSGDAE
jgi:hypothetical protein